MAQTGTYNALKVQVVALSSFDVKLAEDPLIKRFLFLVSESKLASHIKFLSWDLSTVLKGFLNSLWSSRRVFGQNAHPKNRTISMSSVCQENRWDTGTVNFGAILYDPLKIILSPDPAFLPKVPSNFHRTLSYHPSQLTLMAAKRETYSKLGVRRIPIAYLERTKDCLKASSLLVLYSGSKWRPAQASKSSITRWIRMGILLAYQSPSLPPPSAITVHSTRAWLGLLFCRKNSGHTRADLQGSDMVELLNLCRALLHWLPVQSRLNFW